MPCCNRCDGAHSCGKLQSSEADAHEPLRSADPCCSAQANSQRCISAWQHHCLQGQPAEASLLGAALNRLPASHRRPGGRIEGWASPLGRLRLSRHRHKRRHRRRRLRPTALPRSRGRQRCPSGPHFAGVSAPGWPVATAASGDLRHRAIHHTQLSAQRPACSAAPRQRQ